MLRGGAWNNNAGNLRCAYRNRNNPTNQNAGVGFRCAQDAGTRMPEFNRSRTAEACMPPSRVRTGPALWGGTNN
ncbi:hypothetical protein HUU05_27865 [candidate division KSB1 bacterium]|nr:hypothetical protein [candidate division KSB1 bacterium]